MIKDISVMVAGEAGDGVLFTGNVLAKILKREGWEVQTYRYFPSNIRGEPTQYTVRASQKKFFGRSNAVDVLISFNCESILKHTNKLAEGGVVLCDGEDLARLKPASKKGRTFHEFPLRTLAREHFKNDIFKNMIALGALIHILGLDFRVVERIIVDTFFKKKGREVVRKNVEAVNLGCEKAKKLIGPGERHTLVRRRAGEKLFLSGDEAIAVGALAAGCRFFSAYPICPATEIWQWLAVRLPQFGGIVIQAEDELSAVNMALGASYAGARAMTATSGPGGSLMMEAFGLAGMAEIPIVIAHVQRVGPGTGMPTKSEQSDLNLWAFGSHGEFPRIILSPGSVNECFDMTVKAFNLADKYQCPVILLTEQDFGQNFRTADKFNLSRVCIDRGKLLGQMDLAADKEYRRYACTSDGVSPRAVPSLKNGVHLVEGNEHDERGFRSEDPENRIRMMDKRMLKMTRMKRDLLSPRLWGVEEAEIGILGFGSTLGAIVEAQGELRKAGIKTKFLQIRTLWPFPEKKAEKFIASSKRVFVVENNYTGQLFDIIRARVNSQVRMDKIVNFSSLSFRSAEISGSIEDSL